MRTRKTIMSIAIAMILMILVTTMALAANEAAYTRIPVHFVIPTIIQFTVTLAGGTGVISYTTNNTPTLAAPTTMIDFNTTNGYGYWLNAQVEGGSAQADGTPILTFQNTGTAPLNFLVNLNKSLDACISVVGARGYNMTNASAFPINVTSNATIVASVAPNAAASGLYLFANFSGCSTTADTTGAFILIGQS